MSLTRTLYRYLFGFKKRAYRAISDNCFEGSPIINQPSLIRIRKGGELRFEKNVKLGFRDSPYFYSGYIQIRLESEDSTVSIGKNTILNNNASLFCGNAEIQIGADCLIGPNFYCSNSDGHMLDPDRRRERPQASTVKLGDNVFIGAHVIILKGVEIGENSVIAAGSVVTRSFPSNSIIGGNPAKLIRDI